MLVRSNTINMFVFPSFLPFFQSNKVIVLTSNSTTYHVTNKKQIKKFTPVFTVQYTGTDAPSGTCSELQIITSKYQGGLYKGAGMGSHYPTCGSIYLFLAI